ncbi:MAG: hypothetical protein GY757_01640 [bacterium]|nr:hypothetical protein [bacterium]
MTIRNWEKHRRWRSSVSRAWGKKMADCPQEPEWHREGDVQTHTELFCEALSQLE